MTRRLMRRRSKRPKPQKGGWGRRGLFRRAGIPTRSIAFALTFGLLAAIAGWKLVEPANPFASADTIVGADIRVIDGDTVALGEERIRILNIDTPESGGRAECPYERRLAAEAAERARELFRQAETVEVQRDGVDRYERTLARVRLDGRDFGQVTVSENLAVPWAGRQHDWCG